MLVTEMFIGESGVFETLPDDISHHLIPGVHDEAHSPEKAARAALAVVRNLSMGASSRQPRESSSYSS